ncbi:S8 family serine peptidase [Kitasatospora purpeofusca]|uniref:S8 family serine peptidase n=1 Tax=Kitasatospora purpeofusca TaxID=67352 RepID=UPI0036D3CA01
MAAEPSSRIGPIAAGRAPEAESLAAVQGLAVPGATVLRASVVAAERRSAAGPTLPEATPGTAPGAAPPGGAELPAMGQTVSDVRQNGCRKPSGRVADRSGWAQAYLRPETAWPLSRGAGVTVAVIGSGVDASAGAGTGALAGRLALGPRLHGEGDAGRDCVGHGTVLASLIAGRRTADGAPSGVAPGAKVLAVAVTDDAGSTSADLLARGIRAAADGGARIAVVGTPIAEASPALADAVGYATAKGMLLVAPVGPDGQAVAAPVYPAGYPGVLAVAALGADGAPADGPASSAVSSAAPSVPAAGGSGGSGGRASRVDLVAPGEALLAAGPGGGTFTASGPSYAAALVAGAAALVLGRSPSLTVEQLAERLRTTAYRPGTALPDPLVGWGTVDPVTAVAAGGPPTAPPAAPATADGARPTTEPVVVPPPADRSAQRLASAVAGASLGGAALVGLAAAAVRAGRNRGGRRPQ